MSSTRICPRCKAVLPAETPPWLCPKCLLEKAAEEPAAQEHGLTATAEEGEASFGPLSGALPCRLGAYELIERIGQGGMGVVYKARQVSLERDVAVKLLSLAALGNQEALHRFRTEAVTAGSLQHPNIVAVHEVGLAEGQHYLVMDYVPGPTLADMSRKGPLPARQAAQYLRTIAEAVHFAHERGILHRDLKPSNVLIDPNDQPRVTDFGLAKRLDTGSEFTLSGQVLGSPAFIPPEQASGRWGRVGRRSDVYALGAILYQLLTGRPPFVGEAAADTLRQVLNDEPLGPRLLNPAVPLDLETICLKCLDKEPDRRYATAQAMAEELGRFLERRPIMARRLGLVGKVWRWCRRKPVLAGLIAGLALAIVGGLAGILGQLRRTHAAELTALGHAYAADMNVVQQALADLDLGRARDLLNRYRPAGESKIRNPKSKIDLRRWEWRYLWERCQSEERFTLHRFTNAVWALAFSPDGKWLAVRQEGGTVDLWDAAVARRPVTRLSGTGSCEAYRALAFSPCGNVLAWGSRDASGTSTASLWDVDAHREIARLPHSGPLVSLSFSPDACELATLADDGTVRVWDVTAKQVVTNFVTKRIVDFPSQFVDVAPVADVTARPSESNFSDGPSPAIRRTATTVHAGHILFSRDGRRLALGEGLPRIRLWDWTTGREEIPLQLPATAIGVTALAFSPDGEWLAAAGESECNDVHVWDLRTRAERRFSGHRDAILGLAFSPDGETLASVSSDTTLRLWDVISGIERRQFHGDTTGVRAVAWSLDGKDLVTGAADGTVRYWDPTAKPLAPNEVLPEPVWPAGLAFLPDSQSFLTVNRTNGAVVRWDTATLQRLETLPFLGTNHFMMDLSREGRWLALGDTSGHIEVWDFRARRLAANLVFQDVVSCILFFSPDSRYLGCGGFASERDWRPVAKIWEVGSWREVRLEGIPLQDHCSFDFSPRESTVGIGYFNGTAAWWDLVTGKRLAWFDCRDCGGPGVKFSADGKRFATAGVNGLILWDVTTRSGTPAVRGSPSMCFSPDGARLVTFGTNPDRLVRVWDVTTGRDVATLPGRARGIIRPKFSPDGHTLVGATTESVVLLWRAPSWEAIETVQRAKTP
ncbi:MAG: WD40 repeat domain-containing serine/threonine protein kinase [Verrucomicrobiia bacterium]